MPWPHYPNKNVFNDSRNRLYGKSASLRLRYGGKLFHSPGPAAAKALSAKVLWVRVMTHVRLSVKRSRVAYERRRRRKGIVHGRARLSKERMAKEWGG